ncbi:MAG: hypothetical protein ACOCUW_05140 [Gemmatimonadota bacterium]
MRRALGLLLLLWPAAGWAQGAAVGARPTDGVPSMTVRSADGPAGQGAGRVPTVPVSRHWPAAVGPAGAVRSTVAPADASVLTTPAGAFAASLVVPGAGQAALGLKRWVAYGAVEVVLWAVHLEAAADVRSLARAYRDLAWEAARRPTGVETRQDGSWGYYETMSRYPASGAYDLDPAQPGLQPETDPETYNGTVWELARDLYLPPGPSDPDSEAYAAALTYYEDRAPGPAFLWSWVDRPDDLERFRALIEDADREARVRSTALGLVFANHLVSAVDALIVARLRGDTGIRLESRQVAGTRWDLGLKIPLPN